LRLRRIDQSPMAVAAATALQGGLRPQSDSSARGEDLVNSNASKIRFFRFNLPFLHSKLSSF
jgi:hypothetical protein